MPQAYAAHAMAGAPSYAERKEALIYAFFSGFETSVSIEPMPDSENIVLLVEDLELYVTDAIWIALHE
jgi:hypothetical protein